MSVKCILLVEADIIIRTPLALFLRECGYKVLEAFNTTEAREILQHGLRVDVILADADSPGESGFAFAVWVRAHHPSIEVILAGNVERAVEKAGRICEEGPQLGKPYEHKLVLEEIKWRLAARGRDE